MEEHITSHVAEVSDFTELLDIVIEDFAVHGVRNELLIRSLKIEVFREMASELIKVVRRQQFSRSYGYRLSVFEYYFLQVLRESELRLSHHALEVCDNAVREVKISTLLNDVLRCQVVLYHEYRKVSYHFG